MVVIGFDPGSIRFGVGVLKKENNKISFLHTEVIRLNEETFNEKMKTLWQRLDELYREFRPASAAIEEGFLGKNVKSMNVLAKVRGVVLGSVIHAGLDMISYSPREIKLALTGSGSAEKEQVKKMVTTLLNLKGKKTGFDESDALAVAYCHLLAVRA